MTIFLNLLSVVAGLAMGAALLADSFVARLFLGLTALWLLWYSTRGHYSLQALHREMGAHLRQDAEARAAGLAGAPAGPPDRPGEAARGATDRPELPRGLGNQGTLVAPRSLGDQGNQGNLGDQGILVAPRETARHPGRRTGDAVAMIVVTPGPDPADRADFARDPPAGPVVVARRRRPY